VDISGRTVFLVARPSFVSRQRALRLATQAAGKPGSGRPGPGSLAVYGLGGTIGRLRSGSLIAQWERLARAGAEQVSEIGFLRAVGLIPRAEPAQLIEAANFSELSGLDDRTVTCLAIAGALEPEGGRFPFRDVRLGREIARLLAAGYPLAGVAEAAALMRRHEGARIIAGEDEIAVHVQAAKIELSGQTQLPFGDAPGDLEAVLDEAETAEESGDAATARRLYETAVRARPRDAVIRYNLGCVLTGLSELDQAEMHFRIAVSLDPSLAEAHFNIAHIRRLKADAEGELQALERALEADPDYVEALVALVRWLISRDRFEEVRPLIERIERAGTPDAFRDFVQRATMLCELSGRLTAG
jgi:tetratricopeptide (TPR) repeat protein